MCRKHILVYITGLQTLVKICVTKDSDLNEFFGAVITNTVNTNFNG